MNLCCSSVHAIFNNSQCFKLAMVTSAPKSSNPSCLNDYRPVALIYVAMKALEHSLTIWTLYTTGGGKPLCM